MKVGQEKTENKNANELKLRRVKEELYKSLIQNLKLKTSPKSYGCKRIKD